MPAAVPWIPTRAASMKIPRSHAASPRFSHAACRPRSGRCTLVKTCLYTLTPDRDFVIDRLPDRPNVCVAIGAGHAFKFASAIGRILADLAPDAPMPAGIADFAFDRPILRMETPPKTYMV